MTYSIVARDGATGELGVAVQSHFFSVGPVVPWARPGVGVVATQANARLDYGPLGLDRMATGASAAQALAELRAADPGTDSRQVAMVDAGGGAAAFTGPLCIRFAGDVQGDGVSCQANIMRGEGVPEAMLAAFQGQAGRLPERLLAALDAAEAAGGDLRGRQSVALLVVPATGEPWETVVSLRVEDAPDPLGELARLIRLRNAYECVSVADEAAAVGDHARAGERFAEAARLAPESLELRFWAMLSRPESGAPADTVVADMRALCAEHPEWRELLARLPAELAPAAGGLLAALD